MNTVIFIIRLSEHLRLFVKDKWLFAHYNFLISYTGILDILHIWYWQNTCNCFLSERLVALSWSFCFWDAETVTKVNGTTVAPIQSPSSHDLQVYGIIVTILLCFIVFGGVKMINRVAPAFLIPVLFSVLCIFLGVFLAKKNDPAGTFFFLMQNIFLRACPSKYTWRFFKFGFCMLHTVNLSICQISETTLASKDAT